MAATSKMEEAQSIVERMTWSDIESHDDIMRLFGEVEAPDI
jgi:hypothetical protein